MSLHAVLFPVGSQSLCGLMVHAAMVMKSSFVHACVHMPLEAWQKNCPAGGLVVE